MKNVSKIIILSISIFFILSCGNNNDSIVKLDKYKGRYEGVLNTTQNTRQVITNKCTLIVNESTIEIVIEGGNIYDDRVNISKEELTKVNDDSYQSYKNGKNYTFNFYSDHTTITIANTDNTTTKGQLSKVN